MARKETFDTDEDYETGGIGDRYSVPGEMNYIDQLTDPDIMNIRRKWGIPDPRKFLRDPPPEQEEQEPKPDPDDDVTVAGDMPTDKEGYDKWRSERQFSQANADDLMYSIAVKRNERLPEWKMFMSDLGEQAKKFSPKELLQIFQAWNEDRKTQKPAWLPDEEEGPSDLKSLNEDYPPDDRNEAMGAAPPGNFMPAIPRARRGAG